MHKMESALSEIVYGNGYDFFAPKAVALSPVLLALASRQEFSSYAKGILGDDEAIEEIAARSHLQGNGFIKIMLRPEYPCIRLHIWLPDPHKLSQTAEWPHNHRRPFGTAIMYGSYHHTTWTPSDGDGLPYSEYIVPERTKGMQAYRDSGKVVTLKAEQEEVFVPGQTHILTADIIHSTHILEPETVSLTFFGEPISDTGNMYVPRGKLAPEIHSQRAALTPQQTREYLETVVSNLG